MPLQEGLKTLGTGIEPADRPLGQNLPGLV
jgi:hypothetical protein